MFENAEIKRKILNIFGIFFIISGLVPNRAQNLTVLDWLDQLLDKPLSISRSQAYQKARFRLQIC